MKKLKERFPDQLLFVATKLDTTETAVSTKNVSSYVLAEDTSCVVEAGNCLREDIYATANGYRRHLGHQLLTCFQQQKQNFLNW